jgi:hypothetical protein
MNPLFVDSFYFFAILNPNDAFDPSRRAQTAYLPFPRGGSE